MRQEPAAPQTQTVKPTFPAQHGHKGVNPKLLDSDFEEAIRGWTTWFAAAASGSETEEGSCNSFFDARLERNQGGRENPSPPAVPTRHVVASRGTWPGCAPLVAQAAWPWGYQGAARKAFAAVGSKNPGVRRRRFSGPFVPALDCMPALTYVLAATLAGRKVAAGWPMDAPWIAWVWQGQVAAVDDCSGSIAVSLFPRLPLERIVSRF